MQTLRTAARSFSLIVLAAASVLAQNISHSSTSSARGSAVAIEKANKRPISSIERSIKEYEALLSKSPQDAVLLNNLGASYFMSGRHYEGQSLIRRAAERAPDSDQININLAIAYNRVYNPGLAITTLERVLQKHPSNARVRPLLCDIYGAEKRNAEAASCYEESHRTKKLDALSASNFATVLLDLDETDRAITILQAAAAEFADDPGVMNGLGVALFRKKKYSQAETYLVQAVRLQPEAVRLRFNLALSQMMTKNKGAVLEQYRYLKTADPELAGKLYKMIFGDKLVFIDNK